VVRDTFGGASSATMQGRGSSLLNLMRAKSEEDEGAWLLPLQHAIEHAQQAPLSSISVSVNEYARNSCRNAPFPQTSAEKPNG
jgi:hypothetical protein